MFALQRKLSASLPRIGAVIGSLFIVSAYGCSDAITPTKQAGDNPARDLIIGLASSVQVTLDNPRIAVTYRTQARATAYDASGRPLAGRTPVWVSSNPSVAAVSLSGLVTGRAPGTANIQAIVDGVSGGAPVTVTATPEGTQLLVTTQPGGATSGQPFQTQPVVEIRDVENNRVTSSTAAVTVQKNSGNGTLQGTLTVNAVNGVATFADLAMTGSGAQTLTFTSPNLASATSASFTVGSGPPPPTATQLAITTQPSSSAQTGVAFAQQPVIQLRDASSNDIRTSGVVVTASLETGSPTLGGTLTATTDAGGIARFTNLMITGSAGSRTLRFSATSLTGAVSSAINVTVPPPPPPTATKLTITTQPSTPAPSGTAFARQPVIQLRDASNNAVSQSGVSVTAAIATGGGSLGGNLTVTTNASGVATFTNLSITGSAGDRTLSFSAPSLTGVTSSAITITNTTPPAPPGNGEPAFDASANTMVYQDDMNAYTSVTEMGSGNRAGPQISPQPSPQTTGNSVNTSQNQLIVDRFGNGKALRLGFSGQSQTSATYIAWNMPSTPKTATHYFQYYARITFQSPLGRNSMAVKWFEVWHKDAPGRVQWSLHDHLPCPTSSGHDTYWQVFDQRETTCQANQPIGPYFNDLASEGQWHRFTFEFRPNTTAGSRDGVARMWIDGVKMMDVSASAIGVTPPGGDKPWCNADDVDALAANTAVGEQWWGSTQTTDTPPWFYDIDDYKWWIKP